MEFLEGHDLGELIEAARRAAGAVGRRADAADRRGARGGALARHRASRHQADEPVRHVAPRRQRADQGPRLRHLEVADGHRHAADADAVAARHARVHVARSRCARARLVDTRTDIWSLGTVFYEILEGRRPFEAESFSEMCVKVAVDPPAPMVNTPPRAAAGHPALPREVAGAALREHGGVRARPRAVRGTIRIGARCSSSACTRMLGRAAYDWERRHSGANRQSSQDLSSPAHQPPQRWGTGSRSFRRAVDREVRSGCAPWHTPDAAPG